MLLHVADELAKNLAVVDAASEVGQGHQHSTPELHQSFQLSHVTTEACTHRIVLEYGNCHHCATQLLNSSPTTHFGKVQVEQSVRCVHLCVSGQ